MTSQAVLDAFAVASSGFYNSNGYLLVSNIVDFDCAGSETDGKHESIRVELDRRDWSSLVKEAKLLASDDVVEAPGAVSGGYDDVVVERLERGAGDSVSVARDLAQARLAGEVPKTGA